MSITTQARATLAHLAAGALTVGLTAGLLAAPATASATPAAAPPASASHETQQLQGPWRAPDLILNSYGDDGVKGKIKNFTSHTVKVSDPMYGSEGAYYLLPPGGEVTFYNSRKFEYREGRDLLLAGHGAYFDIRRADGGLANYLTLSDPYVGRPDTYFTAYPIKTLRTGWSQNESHHEVTPDASIWIKREKDGWNGGRENSDNRDWAVFTVHIDKI